MMKTLIVAVLLFLSVDVFSQENTFVIQGTAPNLYLSHTVAPKESYYSLARLFNIPPATLAKFNNSNLQTGLRIGDNIKVPLTAQNFGQSGEKESSETMVPLYHVVARNETLFRIGTNYNKVPLTSLKEWNKLSSENIAAGTQLIVGFLKVKTEHAAQLGGAQTMDVATVTTAAAPATNSATKPAFSPEPEREKNTSPAQTTAVVKPTEAEIRAMENAPARTSQPVVNTPTPSPAMAETAPLSLPAKRENTGTDLLAPAPAGIPDEGFFATAFATEAREKQRAENTGEAGTFKTVSGWKDKKYYAMMNNVEVGSIIKITAANKTVYARVLGSLPEVKNEPDLLLRLSNSAAAYLGMVEPKFPIQVEYFK